MAMIWTDEHLHFLRKWRPRLMISECTQFFNMAFDVELSASAVHGTCKRKRILTGRTGCFEKGHAGYRPRKGERLSIATEFKKGNRPHTWAPVGTEVIEKKDGYVRVKIGNPSQWKYKHVIEWERHRGPKPKSSAIIFLDGDRQNCTIDNLYLVTRGELATANKKYRLSQARCKDERLAIIGLVRLVMATRKAKQQESQ